MLSKGKLEFSYRNNNSIYKIVDERTLEYYTISDKFLYEKYLVLWHGKRMRLDS